MSERKILQIMPAGGWCAIYEQTQETEAFETPLVGWALVKEGGSRSVVGLVATEGDRWADCADEDSNFRGYRYLCRIASDGGYPRPAGRWIAYDPLLGCIDP